MTYFKDFPTIYYGGQQAKNLLARAKLTPETKNNLGMYYPYTIKESDGRPEVLAWSYYADPTCDWMLYFANEVVDPYFDMGLSYEEFTKYISKKYGSVERAQSTIAFYRTNWALLDDTTVTIDYYEALDAKEKAYWEPVFDARFVLVSYRRKKQDLIVNTNRVLELSCSNPGVSVGDRIVDIANPSSYAWVSLVSDTALQIQHVTGFTSGFTGTIRSSSGTEVTVTDTILLTETITPDVEAKYWIAVSYYENEDEVNTLKRNIQVLDARYKAQLESDLKKVLQA